LNQREVAQKSYKEALNIYRELAQINPNTYEFDYVKKLVRGVTDYNRDINDLQIAKEILSKEQYKYDASAQELLRKIELIKNG
jgi:hypothetical protein